jgi:hypothetical protein
MGSLFRINLRQLAFATIMGTIALTVRNMNLYLVVLEPFKLDPRWVFSLLAACWTGPFGGLISGTLAAMKLPYPLIDLACIPVHFLIGCASRLLSGYKERRVLACFLWPVFGVPSYLLMSMLFLTKFDVALIAMTLSFIGVSTAVLASVVGFTVEKRARSLIKLLE